jgi:hypothetical protein
MLTIFWIVFEDYLGNELGVACRAYSCEYKHDLSGEELVSVCQI